MALSRAADGLIRTGPPATANEVAETVRALGRKLPPQLEKFLRSWNGADLFQESVRLYGLDNEFGSLIHANTSARPQGLAKTDLAIGDTAAGELLVLDDAERVIRLRGLSDEEGPATWDERWLAGSTLENWLAATVTYELPLYDSEGEFVMDAFEEDGLALVPTFALKLARKVVRKDPKAAELHHSLGVALRRNGHLDEACAAFAKASELDPTNAWAWFDLGRAYMEQEAWDLAAHGFEQAANHNGHDAAQAARFCAWRACALKQAGNEAGRAAAAAEALRLSPGLQTDLQKAAAAAVAEDDTEAYDQVAPLNDAFVPVVTGKRLTLLKERPAPSPVQPPPQKRPPRPAPAPQRPPAKRQPAARTKAASKPRPKTKR
ncbi:MAG: tetratricopeptide repeat protein [Deltaproteobacteria bacterium]|nr:tetratricopeptide repeat protein [Deltaproteobacteria bacterium]